MFWNLFSLMQRYINCLVIIPILFVSACSLLDVSIENPAVPLTDQQMNTRVLTRDFLAEYFKTVEDASDSALEIDNRVEHQLSLAYWRISSEKAAVKAVMQTEPTVALLDLWLLIAEQRQYFEQEDARQFFPDTAEELAKRLIALEKDFDQLAVQLLGASEHDKASRFIKEQLDSKDSAEFTFERRSIVEPWYSFQGLKLADVENNVGSLPQVMSDLSDRINFTTDQTGKNLNWQLHMMTLKSGFKESQLQDLIDSMTLTSQNLSAMTAEQSPQRDQMIHNIALEIHPMIDQLQSQLKQLEKGVTEERVALSKMLASERKIILAHLSQEREAGIEQGKNALSEVLKSIIKDAEVLVFVVVISLILLLITLFGLPFLLGFYFAKYKFRSIAMQQ